MRARLSESPGDGAVNQALHPQLGTRDLPDVDPGFAAVGRLRRWIVRS